MIGNIFKKNESTNKIGKKAGSIANLSPEDIATYITIEGESEIRSPLDKKLTIGREVGELVLSDKSISPRHCTFFKSNGVISIMDHSSENGTLINKKPLDPGKVFILDPKDKIKLGNLSVRIDQEAIFEQEDSHDSQINPDETAEMSLSDETKELDASLIEELDDDEPSFSEAEVDTESEEEEVLPKPKKSLFAFLKKKKVSEPSDEMDEEAEPKPKKSLFSFLKKKEKPKIVKAGGGLLASKDKPKKLVDPSANFISRFISHIYDSLILVTFLEVFSVFTEVGTFYEMGLKNLWQSLEPHYTQHLAPHVNSLLSNVPEIQLLLNPILENPIAFTVVNFLVFLLAFRALSGLIFGVSIGEFLSGIKVEGNFVLKRIMYLPRQVIGVILMPFIVFDMPTFLSKRSFKEIITRVPLASRSKAARIFLFLVITPILFALCFFSPLFKGLELLPQIETDKIILQDKTEEKAETITLGSMNIGIGVPENFIYLPSVEMKMDTKLKKKTFYTGIVFYDQSHDSYFDIKKIKTFSFIDIYKSFVSKNWLSQHFQPEIFALANNVALQNKNFRFEIKNKEAFYAENFTVIEGAFDFDPLTIHNFVMENGLFYRAYRDLREKMSSLFPDVPSRLVIASLNKQSALIAEHNLGRTKYYSFIPLGELQGNIYQIHSNKDLLKDKSLLPSFFSFVKKDEDAQIYSNQITEFIDRSQTEVLKNEYELNQKVYETYFKTLQFALKLSNENILSQNIKQLQKFLAILEIDKNVNQKLYRNLSELLNAAKNKDLEFFNIQKTESV